MPPGGGALPWSVTILSPFRPSSSSSPMCWEWPGWACLVSLRCPCLCSTTYGQPVKSSSPPRPTGQPGWSRSAWTSGSTVLPFHLLDSLVSSCACVWALIITWASKHPAGFHPFYWKSLLYSFPQCAPFSGWKHQLGA